jgi:hypothetical protein
MTVLDNDLVNAIQRDRRIQAIQLRLESEVRRTRRHIEPRGSAGESRQRWLRIPLGLVRPPRATRAMITARIA